MMINSKTNTLSKMMGASCERTDEVRGGRIAAAPNLNLKDDFDFALEHQLDQSEGICAEKDNIEPTFNKMWVTKSENPTTSGDENGKAFNYANATILMVDGKPKMVHTAKPAQGQSCIIDWVNFSVGLETFGDHLLDNITPENREEVYVSAIEDYDFYLKDIFGFHVGKKYDKGRYLNAFQWDLLDEHEVPVGLILAGNRQGTFTVMLTGTGCLMSNDRWQSRLFDWLTTEAKRPSLSRVDVAYDDFQGVRSVDWADDQDKTGGFFSGHGIMPKVEHKGAWRRPSGRGRTLTIGDRKCAKYLRVYEKGRKEGDSTSEWTRFEVEFKNNNALIPFIVLIDPTSFFVGSYPCLADFDEFQKVEKIEYIKKAAKINSDRAFEIVRHQFGKYFTFWQHVFTPDEILKLVSNPDPDVIPPRLLMPWRYAKLASKIGFITEQIPDCKQAMYA